MVLSTLLNSPSNHPQLFQVIILCFLFPPQTSDLFLLHHHSQLIVLLLIPLKELIRKDLPQAPTKNIKYLTASVPKYSALVCHYGQTMCILISNQSLHLSKISLPIQRHLSSNSCLFYIINFSFLSSFTSANKQALFVPSENKPVNSAYPQPHSLTPFIASLCSKTQELSVTHCSNVLLPLSLKSIPIRHLPRTSS